MPVSPLIVRDVSDADQSTFKATWVLTTANPIGIAIEMPEWPDKTWTTTLGTVGGSVLEIQGSNTNVEVDFKVMLNAADGTVMSVATPPAILLQAENPLFCRPKLTTIGSGATQTVTVVGHRRRFR